MMKTFSIISIICLLLVAAASQCPPTGFTTKEDLSISYYIAMPWYPIKQNVVWYQPEESFYCVRAKYALKRQTPSFLCFLFNNCDDTRISVLNSALYYGVDGERSGRDVTLQGIIPDESDYSKIRVGTPFLEGFLYGDYYIVDAGKYTDLGIAAAGADNPYDWAIISGGAPDQETGNEGKCLPISYGFFQRGFWLFSRDPIPPEGFIEQLEMRAYELGFDTSQLKTVTHEGCTYD